MFHRGEIKLCALLTPSEHLLLSHGSLPAVEALALYSRKRKWKLAGVSGADSLVRKFVEIFKSGKGEERSASFREFKLFQTMSEEKPTAVSAWQLRRAEEADWPKVRLWAQRFALESDPPLNLSSITGMARQMMRSKDLHLLCDNGNEACSMAGFGRATDRFQVVNMVYVPMERRRKGLARELVLGMIRQSRASGYEGCLLFSEWGGSRNLYDSMGCLTLGSFVECDLT